MIKKNHHNKKTQLKTMPLPQDLKCLYSRVPGKIPTCSCDLAEAWLPPGGNAGELTEGRLCKDAASAWSHTCNTEALTTS